MSHPLKLAADHAQTLQRGLERDLSATYAIAALVRQGRGVVADYEAVMFQDSDHFKNINDALREARGGSNQVAQLLVLVGWLDAVIARLESDYDQARAMGSLELKRDLQAARLDVVARMRSFQSVLERVANGVPSPDQKDQLEEPGQAALLALDGAWKLGVVALDGSLQARVDRLFSRMWLHLGTALLLLGAILSLVYLVASQIARPLKLLARVADRVRGTADYTHRAQWDRRDEIGQLYTAFNGMLAQLDRDRLAQQELAVSARAAAAQRELIEAFPTPMVVTSVPEHEVLHANAPAQRWLGGHTPSWAVLSARRLNYQGRDAVLMSFAPINKLKVMEQRLELWAKVFEASTESMVIMNTDKEIISVNQAFCRSTSYDFHEVIGKDMAFVVGSAEVLAWTQGLGKDVWAGEVRIRKCSGETYPAWMMVSAMHKTGARGQVVNFIATSIDITDRKAHEERIHFLAHHDVLTELPNRSLCQQRLAEALAHAKKEGERVAVLFIDLDRFKLVNDTLGHHIGDGLLRTVSRRLTQAVRTDDTVSRLGGEEFVVIMRHAGSREELQAAVNQRMLPATRQSAVVEGHTIAVSCSIGVALYTDDAIDQIELMRRADAAMYEAKAAGRDLVRFFSVETDQRIQARQTMEV